MVFVNGEKVAHHSGGHLPFEGILHKNKLSFTSSNLLTVAVNSTLNDDTVPQGSFLWIEDGERYPKGYFEMAYKFDFFNYGGIHRPVSLYAIPSRIHITDITVMTQEVSENLDKAIIQYDVSYFLSESELHRKETFCYVELLDKSGSKVSDSNMCKGQLHVDKPNLWWPYLMHSDPGYLYRLHVRVHNDKAGNDVYSISTGIRVISWGNRSLSINHRPFYMRGFGKHEDADLRGKGLDLVTVTKDFNLIHWMGANSFRTSHYPYAEEIMDFADAYGIAVIDETPAVSLYGYGEKLLKAHKQSMTELFRRDKNRPSVIMWSIANEPTYDDQNAAPYFKELVNLVRSLDITRPITLVTHGQGEDFAIQDVDIVGINRYYGWYENSGYIELVRHHMDSELNFRAATLNKPVYIAEYGADTIAGLHQEPSYLFTEEYQSDSMIEYFKAFDAARKQGHLVGEMIWNFADFMTKENVNRVVGNKKGIFTRNRQPKASAHLLKSRYWQLAKQEMAKYNVTNKNYVRKFGSLDKEIVGPCTP